MASPPPDDPLDPGFVRDLGDVEIEELRRRRDVADKQETVYSYVRRMVQGPLDIVQAEMARRAAGEASGDLSDLVERLPAILGGQIHAPGLGRLPQFLAPGEIDHELAGRLESIVTNDELSELPGLSDEELSSLLERLQSFEREISDTRLATQRVVDQIKAEVVRRYREGVAPV